MIKPLGDKIVITPAVEEAKSAGGIFLPESSKKKPTEGTVVAVGPGRYLENGERFVMPVKVGDVVIYGKYGGTEVSISGKDYILLDIDSVYAIKE